MQIYGPGGADRSDPVFLRRLSQRLSAAARANGLDADEVEISDMGRFLSFISQLPKVRKDRVDALRRQIERGDYDVEEKIEEIVDALLEDLGVPPTPAGNQ